MVSPWTAPVLIQKRSISDAYLISRFCENRTAPVCVLEVISTQFMGYYSGGLNGLFMREIVNSALRRIHMTTYLGYLRVSTEKQSLGLQLAALSPICGDRIWQEKRSGMTQAGRSELAAVVAEAKRLRSLGEPVTLVCYSLSRLGRRLIETVSLLEELSLLGIGFKSVSESLDTSTPMGRAFANIICALGQAEAELISERTKAGLEARRAAGVKLGRPVLDRTDTLEQARHLLDQGLSVRKTAKQIGVSNSTLLRLLKAA